MKIKRERERRRRRRRTGGLGRRRSTFKVLVMGEKRMEPLVKKSKAKASPIPQGFDLHSLQIRLVSGISVPATTVLD